MGYQALLFCPDEKLARVVSQVFSELDFSVEPLQEPFAAVKRLMTQRYDAIVVDCENEPNASLLFKSARNSSSNQSSLAIALVEGQAGVAKAYRIGANLVLTKPINVEQAKGTLRVARGLLRKNLDAAGANLSGPAVPVSPAKAAAGSDGGSFKPMVRNAEPVVASAPTSANELPEFESSLPAMVASAKVEESPVAAPPLEAQTTTSKSAGESRHPVSSQPPVSKESAKPIAAPAPVQTPSYGHTAAQGAAAAPAKETSPAEKEKKEKKTVEFEPAYEADVSPPVFSSASALDGPSFAALGDEDSDGAAGGKKILIGAIVLLVLATLGYLGWMKLGTPKTSTTPQPVSAPQEPATPPTPRPMSAPLVTPSGSTPDRANSTSQAATQKVVASAAQPDKTLGSSSSPVLRIAVNPDANEKKSDLAPMVVKSTTRKKTQAPAEDSSSQLPSPLAVASANESSLSALAASTPASLRQPSLATLRISQGVSQGLLIKRIQPKYPQNALAMRLQGTVQLEATINKEGNITNLTVLKGDAVLARAAMDAVRQWRYKPYYLDGTPVEIQTQITVNFKLPN